MKTDITVWLLPKEERTKKIEELKEQKEIEFKKEREKRRRDNSGIIWELWPNSIYNLYKQKQISKSYSIYLLKTFIDWDFTVNDNELKKYKIWKKNNEQRFITTTTILKAIGFLVQIEGINDKLCSYLESLLIDFSWKKFKIELIVLYIYLFKFKANTNNVISYLMINDKNLTFSLVYNLLERGKIQTINDIGDFIKDKRLKRIFKKQVKWQTYKKHLKKYFSYKI